MVPAVALKKTTSNSDYFLLPYYYEVSKSSYSEQYAAYDNTLILIQYLSQKMQQLNICKQKANERLFKKTGKRLSATGR